jgi:uncharacterized membrane protein YphA (DoxX/SURF4 family)
MRKTWLVWLERLGRWAVAGIFLGAAVPKILNPGEFASDVSHYAIPFWDPLVNLIAITVPWVEAVTGLALLSGFAAEGAILLSNGFFLFFMVLLGQAWVRGLDIDCGCFGHSDARGHVGLAFLRDIGFLSLAAVTLWLRRKRNALAEEKEKT